MSKAKARGFKDAAHVRLYFALMDSAAWLALSCPARVTYLEFRRVGGKARDKNRLELSYPWLQERQGICRRTAARAFIELGAFGFIDGPKPGEHGGLFGRPNVYRLSNRWQALEGDGAGLAKAKAVIAAYDKKQKAKRPPGDIKRLLKWRSEGAPTERLRLNRRRN